jgi:hypothetical protein
MCTEEADRTFPVTAVYDHPWLMAHFQIIAMRDHYIRDVRLAEFIDSVKVGEAPVSITSTLRNNSASFNHLALKDKHTKFV